MQFYAHDAAGLPGPPIPCLICGAEAQVLRAGRPREDALVGSLRMCTNRSCLSNGGSQGAGEHV